MNRFETEQAMNSAGMIGSGCILVRNREQKMVAPDNIEWI
jgi:hypothetical protein